MPLRTSPKSILGATLAAAALLTSPAMARPLSDADLRAAAGTSSLAGTVTPRQDLRGEHARDTASTSNFAGAPRQDLRGEHARDAARPVAITTVDTTQPATRTAPEALPTGGNDGRNPETWLLAVAAIAGLTIVAGGTAGVVRARRIA